VDGGNEHRFAIRFCFKAGVSATETLVLVQKAYGNEALMLLDVILYNLSHSYSFAYRLFLALFQETHMACTDLKGNSYAAVKKGAAPVV
jgi:cystathionine beta-lyase/cystathionine gamma-synthase